MGGSRWIWVLGLIVTAALIQGVACAEEAEEKEQEVPVDQVPAKIKKAAEKAVAGFSVEEAEKETEGDVVIWELEGPGSDGKTYEIELDDTGKVLKVELEDDDDDDDDGDDEDDDEDDDDDGSEK